MTTRHEDEGILDTLRDMKRRIERLEKGDKGVRVNDTRLGESVLTPNTYTNQIEMKNLGTGSMTPISGVRDVSWSWPGEVLMQEVDDWHSSPAYYVPDDVVANEIVLSSNGRSVYGAVWVSIRFPKLTIHTVLGGITGEVDLAVQPNTRKNMRVRQIHVPLLRNDKVFVKLEGVIGAINNVGVSLRFGQPSPNPDHGIDGFSYEM